MLGLGLCRFVKFFLYVSICFCDRGFLRPSERVVVDCLGWGMVEVS
jgi:hypothetical protein